MREHLDTRGGGGIEQEGSIVDGFMTVAQLAAYLGLSLSAIYKLSSSHQLPIYKPAKKVYFLRSEVDAWLRRHRVAPQEELERQAASHNGRGE